MQDSYTKGLREIVSPFLCVTLCVDYKLDSLHGFSYMKYLSHRNGYYWLRIKPSEQLLPYLPIAPKKEYLKSLGNVTQAQAERKAHPILSHWLKEIEQAKKILARSSSSNLNEREFQELIASELPPSEDTIHQMNEWIYYNSVGNEAMHYGLIPPDKAMQESLEQHEATLAQEGKGVISDFYLYEYELSLKNLKGKTVQQRLSRIKQQFIPHFNFLSVKTLTTVRLQRWIDSYLKLDEQPAHKTLKSYLGDARRYVQWLIRKGYLVINDPFDAVALPNSNTLPAITREAFSDRELSTILNNITKQELKDFVLLAMYTGCRIEEIAKLKAQDVELIDKRYVISIKQAKTAAGVREIPIAAPIHDIITKRLSNTGYLFPSGSENTSGNRSDKYSKQFGRVKSKLGFGEKHVFHSIRKSFITKLEQAGIPESIAADLAGHDKKTMTYGLYSSGSSLEAKLDAIDRISYED
jgi:integrase